MRDKGKNLEWAMKKNLPKNRVKDFFLDLDEAYKRLRNPSEIVYQEYKDLYFKYLEYMNRKDIKEK